MSKGQQTRKKLRLRDGEKCFYCDLPMMSYGLNTANALHESAKDYWLNKFGLNRNMGGAVKFCHNSKETIEHLHRKCEGGSGRHENLVLAHHYCNALRGERTPEEHKEFIKGELENPLSPIFVIKNFYGRENNG